MKTFVLAMCVFLAIVVFVTVSAIFTVSIANDMKLLAESFPKTLFENMGDFYATLEKFRDKFDSCRTFIHFLIGETEEDSIENALTELEDKEKNGDPSGYASARSRLISAIEKIINSESLSLNTVF